MKSKDTPSYSVELTAFHRAFGRELRQAIRAVPLSPGASILDLPCGDGFYAASFARRIYPFGKVVAADANESYLESARRRLTQCGLAACVDVVRADAYRLPFDDDAYDVVWCARSLISLDDPLAALREMKRVVRPAGIVAVLEDDEFHRIIFNGPVNLEIDLHRAIAEAARDRYGSRSGMSPSRRVFRFLLDAGLKLQRRRTFAADRQAPFDREVRRYLRLFLRETRKRVADYLSPGALEALDQAMDPHDDDSLFRRADAELTCLTTLFVAQK